MTIQFDSTRQARVGAGGLLSLVVSCALACSCATTKVLTDAAVAACDTGTVYLSGWYSGMSQDEVMYDPIGGYELVYWIDDANNACHGTPGTNGQPGVAVLKAFKSKAWDLARDESLVTPEQLRDFQEIPASFEGYAGAGLHFVQFVGTLARARSDGKAMRFHQLNGAISIPAVIDVGMRSCIAPVAMRVNDTPVPLPDAYGPPPGWQDPDRCRTRAQPREGAMSEEDRRKYDSGLFAHGTEIHEVP